MPWRFSKLGCNRQWYETAGRGSLQRRANDWIAEKRSPVISVARSRACRDGRGTPILCQQHARSATVYPTGRNWTSGDEGARETFSVVSVFTSPLPAQARGAIAENKMLIGKWDRGAGQFSGRGPSFPEFVALTLHAWTSSRRFSVGSALIDFPTFSWASRRS